MLWQWSTELHVSSQPIAGSETFHYYFPSSSVIAQICLSGRWDRTNPYDPSSYAWSEFWKYTADGHEHDVSDFSRSSIAVNNLTEFSGFLVVGNCSANWIINVFVWPSVGSPGYGVSSAMYQTPRKLTPKSPGKLPEIADVKAVALYEPETGNILHMHTVVTFKGGRTLSEREAVEEAHRQAERAGVAVARLKTKVSSNLEHAGTPHRIDIRSGKFVRLPRPEFTRDRSSN